MPFGALGTGALVSLLEPSIGRASALHAPYLLGALICGAFLVYAAIQLRFDSQP